MTTAHINAHPNAFAETVLMPGDPLRAKYIAENFLTHVEEVTNVRGMLGFTGEYQGKRISVMGHGMGIPSASIYTHELITHYGVKNLIRIGSCGAIHDDVKLRDLVIAMGASTDSKVNRIRMRDHDFAALADFGLLRKAVEQAEAKNLPFQVGNIFSSDLFYRPDTDFYPHMAKYGILGVEMEAAAFYGVAAELGAKALTICTVTDHILNHLEMTSEERQLSLNEMIDLALSVAVAQ